MATLIVAFACAGISYTITCTSVFKWFRESIGAHHKKLDELVHCPWCFNHYVCLAALYVSRGTYEITDVAVIDFIISWFFMVTIGGIIHYVLLRSYEPVIKATIQRQLERLQNGKHQQERHHQP